MCCSCVVALAGASWGAGGGEGSGAGAEVGSSSGAGVVSAVGAAAGVDTLFSACRAMSWLVISICGDQGGELGLITGFGATGGGVLCFTRGDWRKLHASAPRLR